MGRAKGGQTATAASGRRSGGTASATLLADTLTRLTSSVASAGEAHLLSVNALAARTAAGRGDRLVIALSDLGYARQLAHDPKQTALAQTITDNALWHVGNLLAKHDPDSPTTVAYQDALRSYGDDRGPAQIDYLQQQGFLNDLDPQRVAQLRANAGEGYVAAFATAPKGAFTRKGDHRPEFRALLAAERALRAAETMQAIDLPEGSELARARAQALKETDGVLKDARDYLRDFDGTGGTSDQVTRTAPERVIRAEALAAALSDPSTIGLNQQLDASGALERHRALVRETTGSNPSTPVIAVPDTAYLDQMMDYSVTITGSAGTSTLAVNHNGKTIFLGPEVAQETVEQSERHGFSEIVYHEYTHTTQPAAKGSPLTDRDHPSAAEVGSRHLIFETQLLEGATQGLTNYGRRQHDPTYNGELTYYPTYTQMVDQVQQHAGIAPETFYRELSATPTNQRTQYLARVLTGRDDEDTQRQLFEPLLALNLAADQAAAKRQGYTEPVLAQHRETVGRIIDAVRTRTA